MIAKLARVEWLKTRHRFGFWVSLLAFVALVLIALGADYYIASTRDNYQYHPVWGSVLSSLEGFGFLIIIVIVVLLTASEKTWRTERQNVIDGLSRTQYFTGKLLLVVGCTVALWIAAALFGVIFEMLNRTLATTELPFIDGLTSARLAAMLLYLFGLGALGLMFGSLASSSGSALALAFVFVMLQAPIMLIMAQQGGAWQEATAYLPMSALNSLTSSAAWDAEMFATFNEQMRQGKGPLGLRAGPAALLSALYAGIMCGVAYWSIRTRDL